MIPKIFKGITFKIIIIVVLAFFTAFLAVIIGGNLLVLYARSIEEQKSIFSVSHYNSLIITIAFCVVLFFFLVLLTPIRKRLHYFEYIIASVRKVKEEEFLEPLVIKGQDELAELANSINTMSDCIKNRFIRERQLEQSKSELITAVSHDLKTPLTSLIGYLDLLHQEQYTTNEMHDHYIEVAYLKSCRLKILVDELFEYMHFSDQNIILELSSQNLLVLLNQTIGEYILDFEEKQIKVELHSTLSEAYTQVDCKHIAKVFHNLLHNALKYGTPDTEFLIQISKKEDTCLLIFQNHTQFPLETDINSIFDRFYRSNKARSSDIDGTGLGLPIAKKIAELHHGKLYAKTEGDQISFYLELPNQL